MKHLAILLPMTWSIRNVITSGLVQNLESHGLTITLLSRRTEGIRQILPKHSNVQIQSIIAPEPGRSVVGTDFVHAVNNRVFQRRNRLNDQWKTLRKQRSHSLIRECVIHLLAVACGPPGISRPLGMLSTAMYRRAKDLRPIYCQLEALRPDLIYSTVCVSELERPYALAAKDLGIPLFASILSFDNLTSRAEIPFFDYYGVWNARMRDTLVAMYSNINPQRIIITGTPQFDFHRRNDFCWSRIETLKYLRLPPDAHYVIYAMGHKMFTPTEPDLLIEFAKRLAKDSHISDLRIVARLHPLDDLSRWSGVEARAPNLVISSPWLAKPDDDGWAIIRPDDQRLLVSSFAHSDMCINMCSTATLDAAILDRPIIGLAFAKKTGSVEDLIYKEAYKTIHFSPLVKSGGLKLANNWDDLISLMRKAREHPDSDREERRLMVNRECGQVDGNCTERVTKAILTATKDSTFLGNCQGQN